MAKATKAAVEVDANNILTVKRRAVKAEAIQFTGKNGAEVRVFLETLDPIAGINRARNGGSYVKIIFNHKMEETARKGDWIVNDANGEVGIYSPEVFSKLFLIKG